MRPRDQRNYVREFCRFCRCDARARARIELMISSSSARNSALICSVSLRGCCGRQQFTAIDAIAASNCAVSALRLRRIYRRERRGRAHSSPARAKSFVAPHGASGAGCAARAVISVAMRNRCGAVYRSCGLIRPHSRLPLAERGKGTKKLNDSDKAIGRKKTGQCEPHSNSLRGLSRALRPPMPRFLSCPASRCRFSRSGSKPRGSDPRIIGVVLAVPMVVRVAAVPWVSREAVDRREPCGRPLIGPVGTSAW